MNQRELKLGMKVWSNREFVNVPKGTEGEVTSLGDKTSPNFVAVKWNRKPGDKLVNWFNKRDELQYLDAI